jgi:hypothetical protein
MKMEQCSETSAYKIQTPGNYPEECIQHEEWCRQFIFGCKRLETRGAGVEYGGEKSFPPPNPIPSQRTFADDVRIETPTFVTDVVKLVSSWEEDNLPYR